MDPLIFPSPGPCFRTILTLAFYFLRVSVPHYLSRVLPDLERSPLRSLGFLLVEKSHHCAKLQAVEDAGTCLCPVQHPGSYHWTGGLLSTAVEAATELGCAHLHCIATRIYNLLLVS